MRRLPGRSPHVRPGARSPRRTPVAAGLALALGPVLLVGCSSGEPTPQERSTTALAKASDELSAIVAGFAPEGCTDASLPVTVEEGRLTAVLPDAADPSRPADRTFARAMVEGAGFGGFTAALAEEVCRQGSVSDATAVVERLGTELWRDAVARAQSTDGLAGDLPAGDDRPLYWTRLEAMAVLHQWSPEFTLTTEERASLVDTFDRAARGMLDIDLPPGDQVTRVLVSGFDPFSLDSGDEGPARGTVGNGIRHGNPSGATALAIDGTTTTAPDGTTVHYEAYTLPVSYPEFERGYLEDTVGPLMVAGDAGLDASITLSQGGGDAFALEQWNGRYHGDYAGNDRFAPCMPTGLTGAPQLAKDNPGCNVQVPERWGGGDSLTDPPQWTASTLPVAQMIEARTGTDVPRPPGDTWEDESVAFGVHWNASYAYFPSCDSADVEYVDQREDTYPPTVEPTPPPEGSCALSGGGGTYLSNESAYRNTLLRDRAGLDIPAGHIHTPDMQHFATDVAVTDATFEAWRDAIVAQSRELVEVVAAHS
ncbi:conserved hypothetical protein [Cellulomonas flavigena DSM 20109]|uniref:Uncharacterized protein n=1 Tax=Cellulomonas flavigena (strain ATCC 482 / DSM 20109 / BCRC 11376 / JCM 18109 / NBRC 3775 / NCIMB 8073 / NRS 134) TaxID=446466 RepID=D5UK92_CELFN|nr:hypothetical protein [Cellulomonas flavigena]ADG75753.1 conserved hypothetical protein [Cellulomonas flavigena DSM 20109]